MEIPPRNEGATEQLGISNYEAPPCLPGPSSGEPIGQPLDDEDDSDEDEIGRPSKKRGGNGLRKIEIEYIDDKIRRHITFSKRKAGISKKAYELSRLTGAQVGYSLFPSYTFFLPSNMCEGDGVRVGLDVEDG